MYLSEISGLAIIYHHLGSRFERWNIQKSPVFVLSMANAIESMSPSGRNELPPEYMTVGPLFFRVKDPERQTQEGTSPGTVQPTLG
jgi:hypothetical protein